MDVIQSFNWVDIVILIVFVRICYVGSETGFTTELFKLLGLCFGIFISLHYFSRAGIYLNKSMNLDVPMASFLSFLILLVLGVIIFVLIRGFFSNLFKVETVTLLNKWGGLAVGIIRAFLVVSLVSLCLRISTIIYVEQSQKQSYLGNRTLMIAPNFYKAIFNNFIGKIFPNEELNEF